MGLSWCNILAQFLSHLAGVAPLSGTQLRLVAIVVLVPLENIAGNALHIKITKPTSVAHCLSDRSRPYV